MTTGNAAVILRAGIATVLRSESCRRDHAGPPCVAGWGGRERQRFGADLFPFVRSSRCPPWAAACQRRHPAPPARQPAAASEQAAGRTRGPAPTQPRPQLAPRRCAPRPRRTDDPPSDIGRQLYTIDAAAPPAQHTQRRCAARRRRDDDPPLAQRRGLYTVDAAAPAARTPPSATARRRSAGPGRP